MVAWKYEICDILRCYIRNTFLSIYPHRELATEHFPNGSGKVSLDWCGYTQRSTTNIQIRNLFVDCRIEQGLSHTPEISCSTLEINFILTNISVLFFYQF